MPSVRMLRAPLVELPLRPTESRSSGMLPAAWLADPVEADVRDHTTPRR